MQREGESIMLDKLRFNHGAVTGLVSIFQAFRQFYRASGFRIYDLGSRFVESFD